MVPQCWICRRHAERPIEELLAPLLSHVELQQAVKDCLRACVEIRTSSSVILALFYRLECGHYCANHEDHRCCICRMKETAGRVLG